MIFLLVSCSIQIKTVPSTSKTAMVNSINEFERDLLNAKIIMIFKKTDENSDLEYSLFSSVYHLDLINNIYQYQDPQIKPLMKNITGTLCSNDIKVSTFVNSLI